MLRTASAIALACATLAQAQQPGSPTFAQLMADLPVQVHAKTFDLAKWSEAIDPFLLGPIAPLQQAMPAIKLDLEDSDEEVHRTAMAIVSVVAYRRDPGLLAPVLPEVNRAAAAPNDPAQRGALATLGYLGTRAPESSVQAVLAALVQEPPDENSPMWIETLMLMRPASDAIEASVLAVLQSTSIAPQLRVRCVYAAGQPGAGERIAAVLRHYVSENGDKQLRDAAITALTRSGQQAAAPAAAAIRVIAEDASESTSSRRTAKEALRVIFPNSGKAEVY